MTNKRLLICDLDNTLYDWVGFFSPSFKKMIGELTALLEVPEETLLNEFKVVHQRYGNSEQPFAVLELPSLTRKFAGQSREEILERIDPALHQFNRMRKQTLTLYEGVSDTLGELQDSGVKIVGHTEAILGNAYWRMRSLSIERFFSRLYTLEGSAIHTRPESRWVDPPKDFVTVVPRQDRKPNPQLLTDICQTEGVDLQFAFYVGDSLIRDMAMAKQAGVIAIWARYGTKHDPAHWDYLVKVTHWTDEDVQREKELEMKFADITPDYTIDKFGQVKSIVLSGATKASALAKQN